MTDIGTLLSAHADAQPPSAQPPLSALVDRARSRTRRRRVAGAALALLVVSSAGSAGDCAGGRDPRQ